MNQNLILQSVIIPLWILAFGIPIIVVVLLIVISTAVIAVSKRVLKKDFSKLSHKLEEKRKIWSKAKKDTLRKLNHVLIFIGLFLVWYIGLFAVNFFTGTSAGMIPEENNMLLLYQRIINEPYSIYDVLFSLGWFYYLLFFFFYTLCLFMLANEFSRKSSSFSFPFTFFPNLYLSEKEQENYGTYLYFAIGQLFAAFICPPMVFFAILGISAISDLMTSQFGIRFGKNHIKWNQNKTWEGTIAGVITTFLICFFFVGIFWSLIFTIIFLIFDIFTTKPFNVSDNLLIPIGCSLTYIFIRFIFDLNYISFILSWF
ncbi:MAG: hypothetical protein JSV23_00615 [Promethearchaeota archaeon]|nr:MAG: hypothetical protein JSV23_00615 [Candidatus Lokiarchaeota archaeon]